MSLYAVLDTHELASWIGAEFSALVTDVWPITHTSSRRPEFSGFPELLNFFYIERFGAIDYLDPRVCRVVPADPAQAVEVSAPAPAQTFSPAIALQADPILTLPGREAPDLDRLDLGADSSYPYPPFMFVHDNFIDTWHDYCERHHSTDQAFGHPRVLTTGQPKDCVHLLQIANNELWDWSEGGWLHFVLPTEAFHDRDFSQAFIYPDGW
jgi:hypothetical protein